MATESTRTAALLKKIRARHPQAFVKKVAQLVGAGLPDAVLVLNGVVLWIEFKGPKTPVTPIQQATMDSLVRNGAYVLLVRFTGNGLEHTISFPGNEGNRASGHGWARDFNNVPDSLLSYIEATCRR